MGPLAIFECGRPSHVACTTWYTRRRKKGNGNKCHGHRPTIPTKDTDHPLFILWRGSIRHYDGDQRQYHNHALRVCELHAQYLPGSPNVEFNYIIFFGSGIRRYFWNRSSIQVRPLKHKSIRTKHRYLPSKAIPHTRPSPPTNEGASVGHNGPKNKFLKCQFTTTRPNSYRDFMPPIWVPWRGLAWIQNSNHNLNFKSNLLDSYYIHMWCLDHLFFL